MIVAQIVHIHDLCQLIMSNIKGLAISKTLARDVHLQVRCHS